MKRDDQVVSSSEIADWAWCPEAWRLRSLGHAPGNQAALKKGEAFHERKATFEEHSSSAISFGWWLLLLAAFLVAAALLLVRS